MRPVLHAIFLAAVLTCCLTQTTTTDSTDPTAVAAAPTDDTTTSAVVDPNAPAATDDTTTTDPTDTSDPTDDTTQPVDDTNTSDNTGNTATDTSTGTATDNTTDNSTATTTEQQSVGSITPVVISAPSASVTPSTNPSSSCKCGNRHGHPDNSRTCKDKLPHSTRPHFNPDHKPINAKAGCPSTKSGKGCEDSHSKGFTKRYDFTETATTNNHHNTVPVKSCTEHKPVPNVFCDDHHACINKNVIYEPPRTLPSGGKGCFAQPYTAHNDGCKCNQEGCKCSQASIRRI